MFQFEAGICCILARKKCLYSVIRCWQIRRASKEVSAARSLNLVYVVTKDIKVQFTKIGVDIESLKW